ncbi:ribonuclease HI [Chitinophaga sp. YR573]|uniref:ribonuclease H family protein n=1 Tax=Chitinophaga sp. YR573 TaxID=1881040 RepID=UPI0008D15962|nr:ribonuclease H [Chitinophaga sp. YR573]SEW34798.1 ribonuclease HI [Chitinophaga sp. YR573]
MDRIATIYTDGSCHTQHLNGGWAAIIFIDEEKVVLTGEATDTTHNRMELTAVIKAIQHVKEHYTAVTAIRIISDSQYVVTLADRKEKLSARSFSTKKGTDIRNADLVKLFLDLIVDPPVEFIKIKAHQKNDGELNYNIEADKLSRSIVRKQL